VSQVTRFVLVVIALLCCVLAVGCAAGQAAKPAVGGTTETSSATDAGSEPVAAETPEGPANVGDEQKSGPWTFSVTEVYTKDEAPGQVPPPAGKEFMYVDVSIYNSGTTTLEVRPEDFSMKDASGATIEPFGERQAYNAVDMSPLEPNYSTLTAFIYAVDPGSTGYVFAFAPEVDGTKTPMEVAVR